MFKEYFVLLLLGHIIGDFYFQSEKILKKKETKVKWILLHSILYWGAFLGISILVFSKEVFILGIVLSAVHMGIEFIKFGMVKLKQKKNGVLSIEKRDIYVLEQVIHILCIVVVSCYLTYENYQITTCYFFKVFFDIVQISKINMLYWITILLAIHKPANITISHLISAYKPKKNTNELNFTEDYMAGRFIGTLERIVILIFIVIGQYSAIGLVLTAKSIARYDEIAKNKITAEYYLLGTLLSTVFVIILSFLIK
ncbi:DUF3307 domain-containing protein [Clostridium sp. C2-6-12]|uniref:DUF3307 domain-containing protein n=1 Tax=Clostridium sp. C2-6-12 TaxID=2698832 RepID=UPI0013680727|nr:DUF3307 domain-containing protein [Clostridium sp. C2-6-12]